MPPKITDYRQYILDRIVVDEINGCWVWQRSSTNGYGKIYFDGFTRSHILSYFAFTGVMPSLPLDHLCDVKLCANPEHLEPVSREENMRRRQFRSTSCRKGHDWTPENTHVNRKGNRTCRACRRISDYKRYRTEKGREYERLRTIRRREQRERDRNSNA